MALRVGHHRLTLKEQWFYYGKYANRIALLQRKVKLISFWDWQLEIEEQEGDMQWWRVGEET